MRCSQCGMPLSPSRTHCPRCGFAAGGDKRAERADPAPDAPFSPGGGFPVGGSGPYEGAGASQGQWNGSPSPWATQMDPRNPGGAPMQQLSFPGANDAATTAHNADAPFYVQSPLQQDPRFAPATPPGGWSAPAQFNPLANNIQTARPFPQRPPESARNKKSTRTGFTIATLCLVAGALLLVFIYVLSQSLPGSPTAQQAVATNTQGATPATTGNAAATSTSTADSTATTTITTTPLPAQKYIVQAQMASSVDEHTAIPSVLDTNFHVQQKTYLAMTVNPQGQSGAVCLQWYINSQHLPAYDFSFPISPNSQHAFSYIFPSTAGPAYVEIYWASTEKCTDQALAQRVDFTISA